MTGRIQIYITDFGNVIMPDDFPGYVVRKNGLPDRRYKIAADIADYFRDLEEGALAVWKSGGDVRKMRLMDFSVWQKS